MSFIIKVEEISTQRRKVAKTQRFFIGVLNSYFLSFHFASLRLCVSALIFSFPAAAQTVAFLTPDNASTSRAFAENVGGQVGAKLKILDNSLSQTAYLSVSPATPFNLTIDESKRIGSVIGCDFFILIRSATLRRSAFGRAEYYESYAAIYVVSSRTGRLVYWKLQRFEGSQPDKAEKTLNDSVEPVVAEIVENVRKAIKKELTDREAPSIEEVPEMNSPEAKTFRAPIPYRRIKPEYTTPAALYDVTATVDLLVDLDEKGTILRTDVVRWAGFGLDESVEKNVRAMNWRPAERNGKSLPMRFLVRYNFKKIG